MSKKVLAILLIAVLSLFVLSACRAGEKTATKAGSQESQTTQAGSGETKKEAQSEEEKSTAKSDKSNKSSANSQSGKSQSNDSASDSAQKTTAKGGNSGKKDSAQSSSGDKAKDTDGWKEQENGSYVKGKISADVVKYGKTDVDEGEELIEQLAKGGLKGAKKLSSEKTDTTATYRYSGKRIGSDKQEYFKFQYIVEKGTGYLLTVIAENEKDLGSDVSYLTSHLAAVAK